MLGTKLLWPGASRMVKCFLSVSKYARPTSTVLPLSLSSWLVSKAQDRYLGERHYSIIDSITGGKSSHKTRGLTRTYESLLMTKLLRGYKTHSINLQVNKSKYTQDNSWVQNQIQAHYPISFCVNETQHFLQVFQTKAYQQFRKQNPISIEHLCSRFK